MRRRLQVVVDEEEYEEIQRAAAREDLSVSEWVRQSRRVVRSRTPTREVGQKLDAVRAAVRHRFPTADIDEMLQEIEGGNRGAVD